MHYPALLLEHFDEPRNAGELPAGEGHELHGSAGSEAEGAWVRFALRVHQGRIAAIRFRARGVAAYRRRLAKLPAGLGQ